MGKINLGRLNRRQFIKTSAAVGAGVAMAPLYAPHIRAAETIKLGYVSPQTGPLAAFAEADQFIIGQFKEIDEQGPRHRRRELCRRGLVKDSQSNPNRPPRSPRSSSSTTRST